MRSLPILASFLLLLGGVPVSAESVPTGVASPAPEASAKGLLVIAPRAFHDALGDFIAWKGSLLPTRLVALEEILATSEGVDSPEKLKRHLHADWKEHGTGYILLVGDVDVMPVRYMVLDRITKAAFDYAFYPSDLYYADLAKPDGSFEDWNAAKDDFHAGYIGEVRGEANKADPINFDAVDYDPDLAVGRWPASSAGEVKAIAEKSVAYERSVIADTDPKLRRAAFLAVSGWVDTRDLMNGLADKLEESWQIEKRFDGTGSPPPKPSQVRGILNEGAGLMVHTGHGQPDRWEKCFSVADLDQLTNTTSVPVFLSAGCSTAHFAPLPPYESYTDRDGVEHKGTDQGEQFTAPPLPPAPLQTGRMNPTCLGEQLLRKPGTGAVAYIGCNTGSQPYGLTLAEGFINELAAAEAPRLGDCWNGAVRHYITKENLMALKPTSSWTPPSIFFQAMKFMVFGDPSLRLPANARTPPTEVDLRPTLEKAGVAPRAQGERGTCSVFTVASAMEFALNRGTDSTARLSVEYLNWASNRALRHARDGGFFSDLWKGYEEWGICREEAMPYAARFDRERIPDDTTIGEAKASTSGRLALHWIKEWNVRTGLTSEHLRAIRETLARGWPVCGGFRWPKEEKWPDGLLEMRPPNGVFDGHSVLITGYREDIAQPGGGTFTFYNTNRPHQACRMTWEYALAYMNDAAWVEPSKP